MSSKKLPGGKGRPLDHVKIASILEHGWAMFVAEGFDAVSMEAIALASNVSKATLYKHFPNKNTLFAATIQRATQKMEEEQKLESDSTELPVFDRLVRFGIPLLALLKSRESVSFYTTLAKELSRQPRLAADFYSHGPRRTLQNLAQILENAHSKGEIVIETFELHSQMLFGMWQGLSNYEITLNIRDENLIDQRWIEECTTVFLKGCGFQEK